MRRLQVAQAPTQLAFAIQAMSGLVLANLKAPKQKSMVALTDLQDAYMLFWVDGSTIYFWGADHANLGWAVTRALLRVDAGDAGGGSTSQGSPLPTQPPPCLMPILQRQPVSVKASAG